MYLNTNDNNKVVIQEIPVNRTFTEIGDKVLARLPNQVLIGILKQNYTFRDFEEKLHEVVNGIVAQYYAQPESIRFKAYDDNIFQKWAKVKVSKLTRFFNFDNYDITKYGFVYDIMSSIRHDILRLKKKIDYDSFLH
jgi:Mor family transcriptional regulator